MSKAIPPRRMPTKPPPIDPLILPYRCRESAHGCGGRLHPRYARILTLLPVVVSSAALAVENPPDFLLQWGSFGTGNGQFSGAHGIEVDSQGNVYIADTGNNRVQKFTGDGVFILKWGSPGSGPGQFNHPHGIGIGPMGNVYVAETGNNRVQKFTNDGVFITSWGSAGVGDGQFDFPRGLSTDDAGNLYVADRNLNRMQKFTGSGAFLTKWGSPGVGEGQFSGPYSVRAGTSGVVYVSDSANHRVQKFRFAGDVVPAVSTWGVLIMSLQLLGAATIVLRRRVTTAAGQFRVV